MTDEPKTQTEGELKLPSAEQLLEAGVHFGHKTSRWHPKMEQYIFGTRNDVHIFDLEKTLKKLEEAIVFMKSVLARGGLILFIGTKPAAKSIVKEAAQALGAPYVSGRWLGGTLTNFKTINRRLQYLQNLEEEEKSGAWEKYVKKEKLQLRKKLAKLNEQLAGIRNLIRLPDIIFVADVKVDNIAVREAKRVQIPIVAICDTNIDPSAIDYPIPANDDATPSLKIIMDTVVKNLKDIKPAEIKEEKQNQNKEV